MSNQAVKPLSILTIGEKVGETSITNQQLIAAGVALDANSHVVARSSSLVAPTTNNGTIDPSKFSDWVRSSTKQRILDCPTTTTTLGAQAVLNAFDKIGAKVDQIGLLIGDSVTGIEVTPSEGQRIAGSLGLKVPSYDITAGSGAFIVHLDSLRKWKPERVAGYSCLVSSNVASHLIDTNSTFGSNFADGACALVVSNQLSGKLSVEDSYISAKPIRMNVMTIQKFGSVIIDKAGFTESVREGFTDSLQVLKSKEGQDSISDGYFIGSQCFNSITSNLAVEFGFKPDRILGLGSSEGESIGATPGIILSRHLDKLEPGRKVFVVQAGIGFSGGYVVLKVAK